MFKNLKKKIEDVGADLTTVSPQSTLGSSLSSLRRSESRTSAFSGSKESIHSESTRTVRGSSVNLDESRTIHTSAFIDDEINPVQRAGKIAESETIAPIIHTSAILDEDESDNSSPQNEEDQKQSSADLIAILDSETHIEPEKNNVTTSQPSFEIITSDSDLIETGKKEQTSETTAAEVDSTDLHVSVSPTESPAPDVIDQDEPFDSSPVLVPLHVPPKEDPSHELVEKSTRLKNALKRLEDREAEIAVLKKQNLTRNEEYSSLKTEIHRLRDIAAKHRSLEEKFSELNFKHSSSQQLVSSLKLERDSWKIANDQSLQKIKENEAAIATYQKKQADLESRFLRMKATAEDGQKQTEKYLNDITNQSATLRLLETQMDKILLDYQTEKSAKETAVEKLKDQARLLQIIEEQTEEIQRVQKEKDLDIAKIRQDKDQELARVRQTLEGATKNILNEADVKSTKSLNQLKEKDRLVQEASVEIQRKGQLISELQSTIADLNVKMAIMQEDLEGKESNLAIFRRRTAKETETKLRDRDKQIASLERQLEEVTEKLNAVRGQDALDETSQQYLKNVILKFVGATSEERLQMFRAVSVLLKLNHTEEGWLKETMAWKQQWLPGPRPELPPRPHRHSHSSSSSFNGHS